MRSISLYYTENYAFSFKKASFNFLHIKKYNYGRKVDSLGAHMMYYYVFC